MKPELKKSLVRNNEAAGRFELAVGEQLAVLEYREEAGIMNLVHTEVPEPLRGQGIANFLIENVLSQLEDAGFRVRPRCRAVSAFITRHPGWKRIVAE
ncbi:GNAT family N-acetyltransferase [Pedobacter sp. SYP-B3415]|uniref:GNAT family N-acetyltransferase n=1 Tax=Pedobacter sp. SYP-B3415 TaxID=2496641 RepID=UPI00101DF924|nr:GNAT family N-acetyltransferase [Pedobacter sp. SYP-B3415]